MNEDEQNPEMNEQIRHFSIIADHSALPKKTVDQDDVDLAYQESWGNGTKLGNDLVWEPIFRAKMWSAESSEKRSFCRTKVVPRFL